MLPTDLLEVLVCPKSKQKLIYFPRGTDDSDEANGCLLCPDSRLLYRVDAGVPVLLIDEAQELSADAVTTMIQRARQLGVYPSAAEQHHA